mgnify:CR=1 FL=1
MHGTTLDWEEIKVLGKVILKRGNGRFLVLRRSMEAHRRPGCWDFPGGNVEPENVEVDYVNSGRGDSTDILNKVMVREVEEETGVVIEGDRLKVVLAASGFDPSKKLFVIALGYVYELEDEVRIVLSDEHTEYAWVTKEAFGELEVGDDGGMLGSLVARV